MCSPFFQLEVSDTGSTETYRDSVPTNYFRGCHGIVLMYDITNPASLYDLEDWMTDAYHKTGEDSTITYSLIGNKRDQMDSVLGLNDGKLFCTRHDISENLQFKLSAVDESEESLHVIFETLAREIFAVQMNREPDDIGRSQLMLLSNEAVDSPKGGGRKACTC